MLAAFDWTSAIVVAAYAAACIYLGWLGYKHTRSSSDYLIAGRNMHPFIMALSYGSTFISTSAIVGFGGVAAMFGFNLLWLVFLNIFVGIFLAFIFLGNPTRRLGHRLDAHTFPELLGRRYQSKFLQGFAGLIIFICMPFYAAAVIKGGCEFMIKQFNLDYNTCLLIFAAIVAVYVFFGGLKGVMYTDALQGAIMIAGMLFLLWFTYDRAGGFSSAHENLGNLSSLVPGSWQSIGHQGWTMTPQFGFGDKKYDLWWQVFSTIVLGVGIGVLAQPQLVVRFMTVKSGRELNRAVILGGLFILIIPGTAYVCGALSNVYFTRHGADLNGRIVKTLPQDEAWLQLMKLDKGVWVDDKKPDGTAYPPAPVKLNHQQVGATLVNGNEVPVVTGKGIALAYGKFNPDEIIPAYIKAALPRWFGIIFLTTLLAAAMSTLSSQFHALGTSMGRDVCGQFMSTGADGGMRRVRVSMILGIIMAVFITWGAPRIGADTFIARATAFFFGICTVSFLPAFAGGLFSRRVTKAGALASITMGFLVSAFWMLFINAKLAGDFKLVKFFLPKEAGANTSLLWNHPNWYSVDPLIIGLPISILALVLVSALTSKSDPAHLEKCFGGTAAAPRAQMPEPVMK